MTEEDSADFQPKYEELEAARDALVRTLQDESTSLLFGEPVDPTLPGYLDVISHPKDLGTILADCERSLEEGVPYLNAASIWGDVQIVWNNCFTYNDRPEDETIIDILRHSQKIFNREWKRAGLRVITPSASDRKIPKSVPRSHVYSSDKEVEPLGFRLLDEFEVGLASNSKELKGLEALGPERGAGRGLVVSGTVIDLENPSTRAKIEDEAIVDWLAEYNVSEAAIWIVTKNMWYKLLKPTERYAPLYRFAEKGVALSRLAKIELNSDPDAAKNLPELIDRVAPSSCEKEIKNFAVLQMEAKLGLRQPRKGHKRRRISGLLGIGKKSRIHLQPPFSKSRLGADSVMEEQNTLGDNIDAISDDDMPANFEVSEKDIKEYGSKEKARSRLWKKLKYWERWKALEERARAAEKAAVERDAAQHKARGPPPEPCQEFRVSQKCLPDLLMVWEFIQAFGDILQLPYFSFEALEAAVCPGPDVSVLKKQRPDWLHADDESGIEISDNIEKENHGNGIEQNLNVLDSKAGSLVAHGLNSSITQIERTTGQTCRSDDNKEDNAIEKDGTPPLMEQESIKTESEEDVFLREPTKFEDVDEEFGLNDIDTLAATTFGRGRGRRGRPPIRGRGRKISLQSILVEPNILARRQRGVEDNILKEVHLNRTPHQISIAKSIEAHWSKQQNFMNTLKIEYNMSPTEVSKLDSIDLKFAPSGILLRDIVCSLSRAAFNIVGKSEGQTSGSPLPRPLNIQVSAEENDSLPTWPERLANTVWSMPGSSEEARAAALKLAYGDFLDLTTDERVLLLASLVNAALNSESMTNEIAIRIDAMGMAWSRRDGGAADEQEDEDGKFAASLKKAVFIPPNSTILENNSADRKNTTSRDISPYPSSPLELWNRWMVAQHLGLRRKIGIDFGGRIYWSLGRLAGAFRIYVEEPETGNWGYYEGQGIYELTEWLRKGAIRKETYLLASLRNAPLAASVHHQPTPEEHQQQSHGKEILVVSALDRHLFEEERTETSGNSGKASIDTRNQGSHKANKPSILMGKELDSLRPDAYHDLCLPLLRGEWNWPRRNDNGPIPIEMRVPFAIDDMLSTVPYWFKGRNTIKHVFCIADALATASTPRDAARALLAAESFLYEENKLSEEWSKLWRMFWRQRVSSLLEMKDIGLYVASLQRHVLNPDGLSRRPFMKISEESRCTLPLPSPGDEVILLRSGLLQHIDRYMQLVGITKDQNSTMQDQKSETNYMIAESTDFLPRKKSDSISGDQISKFDSEEFAEENEDYGIDKKGFSPMERPLLRSLNNELLHAPSLKEGAFDRVKSEWERLRSQVAALNPLERYVVRSIVFRRHLIESSELAEEETNSTAPCAVAWLCLRPAQQAPRSQLALEDVVVPWAATPGLPEYLLTTEVFVEKGGISWQPGDRLRMFFGGKISSKTQRKLKAGGTWHKGEIVDVTSKRPDSGAPLEELKAYDPWESIVVQWDNAPQGETFSVNPWEIEIDPEMEGKRAEEARRQQQAHARASRARASNKLPPEHPDAAAQAKEWKEEDDRLAMVTAQGERSTFLLNAYQSKPEAENLVFNEETYGTAALGKRQRELSEVGLQDLEELITPVVYPQQYVHLLKTEDLPPPVPGSIPRKALKSGQRIKKEILNAMRALTPKEFVNLLINFYTGLKGKYVIPTFAQKLDLQMLWWEIIGRGGYERVSSDNLWHCVSKSLIDIDSSDSEACLHNLQLSYESCLLDFENYLASGQYEVDLSSGKAPFHVFLTVPGTMKFIIPGAYSYSNSEWWKAIQEASGFPSKENQDGQSIDVQERTQRTEGEIVGQDEKEIIAGDRKALC